MKLITKAIKEKLENTPIYTHDGKKPEDVPVIVKFFGDGRFTYYVTECEPLKTFTLKDGDQVDYKFYGFQVSPLGSDCDELGYAMFNEMVAAFQQKGIYLHLERDLHWQGSLKDAYDDNGFDKY